MSELQCCRCRRPPHKIDDYIETSHLLSESFDDVEEYIRKEEGTYNPSTNLFACDICYILLGQPGGLTEQTRWRADRFYEPHEHPGRISVPEWILEDDPCGNHA